MRNFNAHYVMDRAGGKHLVTAANRHEFANSVKFIQLTELVTDKKDLRAVAQGEINAEKNPPLLGRQKRQARLNRSLKRDAPISDSGLTSAGIADMDEVGNTDETIDQPADEAPVAPQPIKVEKPKVSKAQQAAARKAARERRAEAKKASKAAEKKAIADAKAIDDAE
jgi:hypothetical protein